MKQYKIIFTPTAQRHAMAAAEYIAADSQTHAAHWYAGLIEAIQSLETMPGRCGVARESTHFHLDLRQYIYYSHRIIFQIDEPAGVVYILHIRHAARRAIGEMDEED